jgi:hypothetical protein
VRASTSSATTRTCATGCRWSATGIDWPSLADPNAELAGSLALFGHPAVAVLDENGVVVARHIGGGDAEIWEALADEL